MFRLKNIVVLIFSLFRIFSEVSSTCELWISDVNAPILSQKFGTKTIILDKETILSLDESTVIQVHCGTGLRSFRTTVRQSYSTEEHRDVSVMSFKCNSGDIVIGRPRAVNLRPIDDYNNDYIDDHNPSRIQTILYANEVLQCNGPSYTLFESRDKLPNCKHLSYAMAAKLSTPLILAGLCFDLEKFQLKYVSYNTQKIPRILEEAKQVYPVDLNENSLEEYLQPINHLKFLNSTVLNSTISADAETNIWLRIANFELSNIIQSVNYHKIYFEEYKNMFNIIWWHNLRIGNWHRFMELLEERSQNVVYNIYVGTSGELRVPMETAKCVPNSKEKLIFPGFQTTVPKLVWALLNSTDAYHPESVVVIGYNSPYYEYFEKDSNFLCKDICDEIEWLKPMNDTRLISTMGIINCCHSEDVVGLLDGFPIAVGGSPKTYNFSTTPTP